MIHRGRNVRAAGCGRRVGRLATLALVLGVCMTPAFAETIFYAQQGAADDVKAIDVLGNQESIANGIVDPTSVVVDERRRRIYWTENDQIFYTGLFQTSPSAAIEIVPEAPAPVLADVKALTIRESDGSLVFVANDKIWWRKPIIEQIAGDPARFHTVFKVINLTNVILAKTGVATGTPEDVCLTGNTLYWTDSASGKVMSVTKTGPVFTDVERATGVNPEGIACDSNRNRLYFTDGNTIKVVPLTGTAVPTTFYTGLNNPSDVDADPLSGRVYIANSDDNKVLVVTAGGNMHTEHTAGDTPLAVAVFPAAPPTELGMISPFGKPGSVVVWPFVDSDDEKTLITLTNTNSSHEYCGNGTPGIFEGTVRVKFLFVAENNGQCNVIDKLITLSPNDTFSAFLSDIYAPTGKGWLLAAAVSAQDVPFRELISYNYLIGSAQVYGTGEDEVWGYDAYTFRGLTLDNDGDDDDDGCGHPFTDSNVAGGGTLNGRIDFNDMEYDAFPLVNSIPRIVKEEGNITNFLAVMNTVSDAPADSEINFTIFTYDEQRFTGENNDLTCLKYGSLVDAFGLNIVTQLGDNPNPIEDPGMIDPYDHEDVNSGWLQIWNFEVPEDDTPAILSVFALINSNGYQAGNAGWAQPAAINRRHVTSFASDLTNARPIADIQIEIAVDDNMPTMGNNVTYTVDVTNNGPFDAEGVVVTVVLETGLTYVSDTGAGATSEAAGTVTWNIGDLDLGDSVQIDVVATASGAAAETPEACADLDDMDTDVSTDPNDDNKVCVAVTIQ